MHHKSEDLSYHSSLKLLIFGRPEEPVFSRHMVETLIEQLEARPIPRLTPNEHAHLLVLIQTTLEVSVRTNGQPSPAHIVVDRGTATSTGC